MTKMSVNEDLLSRLLKHPKSKQVFAFEEIQLEDTNEYVEWAVSCLGIGLDELLLPMVSHTGKPEVNYFEIRCDLRSFFAHSNILPVRGKDAVNIYCIGCLEDLIGGRSSERNTLQHLADLLRSHESCQDFRLISDLDCRFWHPSEAESCDDVLRRFHDEALRLVDRFRLAVKCQAGFWSISVA